MELFYLSEHTSCHHYSKCMQEGFRHYKFNKGLNHEEQPIKDCILFVVKGSIRLSCNDLQLTLSERKMAFLSRDSLFSMYALENCEVITAMFDGGAWPCQKASLSELVHLKDVIEYRMEPLEIKEPLFKFLELLACYLKDGANCIHFHEIKLKELFWNIRFYYSKPEQAQFFYTIIGHLPDFKNKVLDNYKECRTVKELASACGVSVSTFKRQFNTEFGETPAEWMQQQLLGEIKYKLSATDLPLGVIANELDFSSLANFSRFCKRCLGYSPRKLREQIKASDKQLFL